MMMSNDPRAHSSQTDGDVVCAAEKVYLSPECPPEIRNGFIRKVYSILVCQLAATFMVVMFVKVSVGPQAALQHSGLFQFCSYGALGLMIGVQCCCPRLLQQFPHNYIILSLLTFGVAMSVSYVTLLYSTDAVLQALLTTTLIFSAMTAYACTTKTDFTGMGPYLHAALWALLLFPVSMWLCAMIMGEAPTSVMGVSLHKIVALCGVLVFTMYIVYDTQLIVGGRHTQCQFSIDDYVFAALSLYLDIINMFLYLLQLFGGGRENS